MQVFGLKNWETWFFWQRTGLLPLYCWATEGKCTFFFFALKKIELWRERQLCEIKSLGMWSGFFFPCIDESAAWNFLFCMTLLPQWRGGVNNCGFWEELEDPLLSFPSPHHMSPRRCWSHSIRAWMLFGKHDRKFSNCLSKSLTVLAISCPVFY